MGTRAIVQVSHRMEYEMILTYLGGFLLGSS
jgi:hypothetical protein